MKKDELYPVPRINDLQELLIKSAETYGNKLALEDLNNTPISKVSFNELRDYVKKLGFAFKNLGLKERSHIALISENRVQWALSYLAITSFNFVVVPIDRNLNNNEILNIIHESDAEAIIFSDQYSQLMADKQSSLKKLKYFISMDSALKQNDFLWMNDLINTAPKAEEIKFPEIDPEAMAAILFTSGSLGRAKGVMLSQFNLASDLMDMLSMLMIYPEDRFLSVLPIHHTYECTCGMLCPILAGASVHYARSLKTVTDDLQKVKATILLGVPLLYDKMFKRIYKSINEKKVTAKLINPLISVSGALQKFGWKESKKKIFKELHSKFGGEVRIFIAGGAAPDPLVAKGLREFGFNFLQGYGLTETSPIVALNRLNHFKDDAAGLPMPSVKIKINNPDQLGNGEIWVKGPNVMLGYYKNPELTNEVFEDGWFKTGDIGFFDEDGFLHISGRKKNVIISKSGKNVFPEEIEDHLNRSPFIMESLVYGEEDSKLDEIIAAQIVVDAEAFIEYSESNNEKINDELIRKIISEEIEKVNKQLSSYKQIKKFYIRDHEFEKTTTQKIKRYLVETKRDD